VFPACVTCFFCSCSFFFLLTNLSSDHFGSPISFFNPSPFHFSLSCFFFYVRPECRPCVSDPGSLRYRFPYVQSMNANIFSSSDHRFFPDLLFRNASWFKIFFHWFFPLSILSILRIFACPLSYSNTKYLDLLCMPQLHSRVFFPSLLVFSFCLFVRGWSSDVLVREFLLSQNTERVLALFPTRRLFQMSRQSFSSSPVLSSSQVPDPHVLVEYLLFPSLLVQAV